MSTTIKIKIKIKTKLEDLKRIESLSSLSDAVNILFIFRERFFQLLEITEKAFGYQENENDWFQRRLDAFFLAFLKDLC